MKCKIIVFEDYRTKAKVKITGIVFSEDELFVYFKTRNSNYRISKKSISIIKDTDIEFEPGVSQ